MAIVADDGKKFFYDNDAGHQGKGRSARQNSTPTRGRLNSDRVDLTPTRVDLTSTTHDFPSTGEMLLRLPRFSCYVKRTVQDNNKINPHFSNLI